MARNTKAASAAAQKLTTDPTVERTAEDMLENIIEDSQPGEPMDEQPQPANPPHSLTMKDMQKELHQIEKRRKKVTLAANLKQAKAHELAGFPSVSVVPGTLTLPVRTKQDDGNGLSYGNAYSDGN